jgi:hypothetical protein
MYDNERRRKVFRMIPPWATKPEMILTYLLFILAGLISVYSSDIRRFIKIIFTVPPNKMRSAWKTSNLRFYEKDLLTLKRLHGNAYELLLYVLIEVGGMAITGAFVVALLLILALEMRQRSTSPEELGLTSTLALVTLPLALAFPLGNVFTQCKRLANFDKRVAYLEKKIAELKADLAG